MVVVFVKVARVPACALAAKAKFRLNRQALNMAEIVMDAASSTSGSAHQLQASALTTASPIWAVPTLVVPSL